jgi:rhomboid protease GluP
MSADPAEESLGHYLTRRLVAEKGFVRGYVPEAAELAAAVDEVLTLDNGAGFVMLALVDHDRRDGATSRNFTLSQADLVRIGKACLQYAPTFNGVKLPVGIQLWHVNAPASPARREALAALQRSPGLDKVSVTGFVLDPAAPTPTERVWTTLPWYQSSHPGPRWLRGMLSSPRRSADELARDLGVPAGDPAVQRPVLTYAIIAALTALFGVELASRPAGASGFSPDITTLVSLGGLARDLVTDGGEWWRLLTAACLHGSPLHLLMNGVALYMAGVVLEHLLGRAWLGALFVVGALGGSLMGLAINPSNLVSVGASGAIMGLLAAALVAAMRLPEGIGRSSVQGTMARVLIPSLLPLASMGGAKIDYAAHFGGALAGALVGLALWKTWAPESPTPRGRNLARAVIALGLLGLAWGAYGVVQTRGVATALAPQEDLRPVATGAARPAELDALVRRWPRDPRVRFIRAAARINADNPAGAEEDLRAALAEERVLRTGFRDRRLEVEVRSLLAQVLAQRGQEAEARAVVAPVCHEGPGGRAPPGLAMLGYCEAR